MTAATSTRRPAAKKTRTVRLLGTIAPGRWLIEIREQSPRTFKLSHYYLDEQQADYGRDFRFTKFACQAQDGPDSYDVNTGDRETPATCECLGHQHHGYKTQCKHIAAVFTLIGEGKI